MCEAGRDRTMNKIELVELIAFAAACSGTNRGSAVSPATPPPRSSAEASSTRPSAGPAAQASSPRFLGSIRLAHPESTLRAALAAFPQYIPPMARDLRGIVEIGLGKVGDVVALDRSMELRFYERTQKPAMVL